MSEEKKIYKVDAVIRPEKLEELKDKLYEIGVTGITGITGDGTTAVAGGTTVGGINGFTAVPKSKVDATRTWVFTYDATNGVTKITLGGTEIYPDASSYN